MILNHKSLVYTDVTLKFINLERQIEVTRKIKMRYQNIKAKDLPKNEDWTDVEKYERRLEYAPFGYRNEAAK